MLRSIAAPCRCMIKLFVTQEELRQYALCAQKVEIPMIPMQQGAMERSPILGISMLGAILLMTASAAPASPAPVTGMTMERAQSFQNPKNPRSRHIFQLCAAMDGIETGATKKSEVERFTAPLEGIEDTANKIFMRLILQRFPARHPLYRKSLKLHSILRCWQLQERPRSIQQQTLQRQQRSWK